MNTLYKDILHDHYRNPRNKGTLQRADFESADYNPSCGDGVSFQGIVVDGVLTQVMFEGAGCVISQATASSLTQAVIGKTLAEILALSADDIQAIIGMSLGPMRLNCATLPLYALQQGIKNLKV